MNNSNYSLRFSRTAREAFGHSLEFNEPVRRIEAWIFGVAIFATGFLLGYLVG